MHRAHVFYREPQAGILAGRNDVIYLPASVDATDHYVLTEPAARTPLCVDEARNLFESVPAASHRAGTRRLDCHITMIEEVST